MTQRKKLSSETETQVLILSRRRCCICFGLDRDATLKVGQIAHLDKDNANNSLSNLAFLCFDHHDEFDSVASQRKGLRKREVIHFRDELYKFVDASVRRPVPFGSLDVETSPVLSGHFVRLEGDVSSAEVTITPLPANSEGREQVHVSGLAFWGTDRLSGPNIGILDDVMQLTEEHTTSLVRGEYKIVIQLLDGTLRILEENFIGVHGHNVTFNGDYRKEI